MKSYTFKSGLTLLSILLSLSLKSQDIVIPEKNTSPGIVIPNYELKREKYNSGWSALVPKYYNLQYAGSIGLLSAGPGWEYGRRKKWSTDLLIGFVPKFSSNKAKMTLTLRQNYTPWEICVGNKGVIEPLKTGIFMNTVIADEFWVKEPTKYPSNYYKFSTRIRFHAYLGQSINYVMTNKFIHKVGFYYELSSCDLYIISKAVNKYLKMSDILSLSFGLKIHIM